MDLSGVYVKFGYAGARDATQPASFDMVFDLGDDQPIYEIQLSLEIDKSLNAPLSELKERARGEALKLLQEAARLLAQFSVAELDQQVVDRQEQQAAGLDQALRSGLNLE